MNIPHQHGELNLVHWASSEYLHVVLFDAATTTRLRRLHMPPPVDGDFVHSQTLVVFPLCIYVHMCVIMWRQSRCIYGIIYACTYSIVYSTVRESKSLPHGLMPDQLSIFWQASGIRPLHAISFVFYSIQHPSSMGLAPLSNAIAE